MLYCAGLCGVFLVARSLTCLVVAICACSPNPNRPDGGDGGPTPCLGLLPYAEILYPTNTSRLFPVEQLEGDAANCLPPDRLAFVRLDAPGAGAVLGIRDGGLSLQAAMGGVYALVDERSPTVLRTRPLYFGRVPSGPSLKWPRFCREVQRLTTTIWACDGQLFEGETPLPAPSTERWLGSPDGSVLAARQSGVFSLQTSELGSDAGVLFAAVSGVEAWAADSSGLSVALDSGFVECAGSASVCLSLGPRFGTGELPLNQQRLVAFMRREQRTLFSVSPASSPFCEARADVQTCSPIVLGALVAIRGDEAWAGSTVFADGQGQAIVSMGWDGGWSEGQRGFVGPVGFFLEAGVLAQTPARVIYSHAGQFLFWQWTASGEAFEILDLHSPGQPSQAGAGSDFIWASTGGSSPSTVVFPE